MSTYKKSDHIKFKIDVTKILKDEMYYSKKPNPRNEGKCPIYLDCIAIANKDGLDEYGNTHFIVQSLSKETRAKDRNARGPIIGNATIPTGATQGKLPLKGKAADDDDDDRPGKPPF